MRRALPPALLACALLGGALGLLAGCGGSQAKVVTVQGAPTTTAATSTATTDPAASAPASTAATTTTATTPPPQPSTTRTAPEPSFTEGGQKQSGATAAAVAVVRAHGYTPQDVSQYHEDQTLRVLVGTRSGSGDGYGQQAFFFLDGRYLGTDAKEPSAQLKVVSQGDTEVSIAYPLYRPRDPLCCPGGGQQVVHFVLNDGGLTALGTIPPTSSASGLSRY